MNYKPYAIALIIGSVLIESYTFNKIYFEKTTSAGIFIILPIMTFIAGLYLLLGKKSDNKPDDDTNKDES